MGFLMGKNFDKDGSWGKIGFERDDGWRGKSIDQFTDAQLNDYYVSNMKKDALFNENRLVYVRSVIITLPQTRGRLQTDEEKKLIDRVAAEYAKRTREAGYKVINVLMTTGTRKDGLAYSRVIYIRDTPNSNINGIPTLNKMYFNHLTKFTRVPMKKILR